MKKKRLLLIMLILSLIIGSLPVSATGEVKQLKDLPTGSIVYDPSWKWEHKTGDGYTGSGTTKPVEWIVVAKNHTGYPTNSVTLITNEIVGKYLFDDDYGIGNQEGYNHWGNSGTREFSKGIRKFLNGSSYTGKDSENYPITFFDAFSNNFKNLVLETTLNMETHSGSPYTTKDKVFLPSENELGGNYPRSDGSLWELFLSDYDRIARLDYSVLKYRTRTPQSGVDYLVRTVQTDGSFGSDSGPRNKSIGVRPALNIKSDTLVKSVGSNRWEIIHNSPPTINITNPSTAQTINATGKITMNGTVKDDDNDKVTISATINGKLKSTDITNTSTQKNWTLEWTGAELNDETYNNIIITAKDDKGNSKTGTYTGNILVDKIKPTKPNLSASPTTPTNKDVTITVTSGTDSGSGVAKTEYRIGTGNWTTYSAPFKISNNGKIEARTIDKVGNISDVESINISNINKENPVITIGEYNTEWTSQDITVTATTDKGTLNQESYTFTKNDSFTFIATDEYGNTTEKIVTITNIDKIKPRIKITVGN